MLTTWSLKTVGYLAIIASAGDSFGIDSTGGVGMVAIIILTAFHERITPVT